MSQSASYSIESLFRGLKGLLGSLPTEDEKSELLRDLKETQDFLEELRLLVDAIPTMESSQELSAGLSRLDTLAGLAHQDAGLRKLLGLRGPASSKRSKSVAPEEIKGRVLQLGATIDQSETTEIANLLECESLAVLKEMANHYRIRTRSKERKQDLVTRISTHIENQQGYQLLRGSDAQPIEQPS